ncbi:MAG: S9 family peptidase [Ignavibacteriales bacterium]|nr:S9 family peptidase [Ignavibacteriales bacterium]
MNTFPTACKRGEKTISLWYQYGLMIALVVLISSSLSLAQQTKRPMTFMDVMEMRNVGSPAVSSDGKWVLYTYSIPDWKAAKSYTDIYLVSTSQGLPSARQMTFTKDKNETSPRWTPNGSLFAFLSNREAPEAKATQNQIYMMRPDGGEASKISDAKEGVGTFAFSKDGKWLAFSAGKEDERQIWTIAVAGIDKDKPVQFTKHKTPITWWQFSPDSKKIYFLAPDSVDKANKQRKEKKFDVRVRNEDSPLVHLWSIDLETKKETRHTSSSDYSVSDVKISDNSKWIGFHGISSNRYYRTVTEANSYMDLYLLEASTGTIERLTNNKDIGESTLSFSPDGSMIAFSADDDFTYFRNNRVYVRQTTDRGGKWKKLGSNFDGDITVGFWSDDGKTIYFNNGWKATAQAFSVSVETGKVTQLTNQQAVIFASRDEDSKTILANFSSPTTPSNIYYISSIEKLGNKANWMQLTNSNPQVENITLGETEEISWKSSDGKIVGGVLVKPIGYEKGKRYPLVVQIHGGPAGASLLNFSGSYGNYSNVYAGSGYVCFLPNYRGSTNYGEKHKMEIAGDYFRQGYEDIMTGVDHLISTGLVDKDKMGAMGWSAGGHWSNWILTHTNRFKAISSGAGAVNWTSMYAQSDIQRNREYYYKGKPYDNFEHYWDVSPLKYIKKAKTPTLIHVVDGDPRVPRPQSEELHMALKSMGIPTEFFVYPGTTHGIPDPRNQMVKMVSEFNWMEKWIRGKQGWFEWNDLLSTLKDDKDEKKEDKKETSDN